MFADSTLRQKLNNLSKYPQAWGNAYTLQHTQNNTHAHSLSDCPHYRADEVSVCACVCVSLGQLWLSRWSRSSPLTLLAAPPVHMSKCPSATTLNPKSLHARGAGRHLCVSARRHRSMSAFVNRHNINDINAAIILRDGMKVAEVK